MRIKYSKLIEYLKAGQGSILSERASSITIGKRNMDGETKFRLIQTFKTLSVQYTVSSIMFGNLKLEWKFDKDMSQDLMFEKIKSDIIIKNKLIIR